MHRRRLIALGLGALLVVGSGSAGVVPVQAGRPASARLPATPSPRETVPLDASGLPPPKGTTRLVSVDLGNDFPSGPSAEASISENGRWVAFSSRAADLVPNDTNDAQDVFIVDRRTGRPFLLPLPGGGKVPPGGRAYEPSIAADGSVVAFTYLPPSGLFVVGSVVVAWERATGKTSIVSMRPNHTAATTSREPSVSGNGKRIAYTSDADGIVAGDGNEQADVFVFDRTTGETTLVSISLDDTAAGGQSGRPSISADGKVVAFDSMASDLAAGGGLTQVAQVYARNLAAGTTELVSVSQAGGYGAGPSQAPATSSDGHAIAFESSAPDLVAGDTAIQDVFVRDRTVGETTLVSVGLGGGPGAGPSGQAAIAADGKIIAFASTADDLVAAAGTGPAITLAAVLPQRSEVLARDLVTGDTIRISEAKAGGPGGVTSVGPAIGGNGRYVAFASTSPLLVAGDDNKLADVFLRDLPPDPLITPLLDFGSLAVSQPALPIAAIVSNRGWGPMSMGTSTRAGAAAIDYLVLADGCRTRRLHRTESCTITVGFTPTAKGTRNATLRVPGSFPGSPRAVRLLGRGSLAKLKLEPAIGNPGIVTVVTGTGFPAKAEVQLSWSVGITPKLGPIVADAKGRFRVQVLVFHHDRVGPRELQAAHVGGPAFPALSAPMLVTTSPDIPWSAGWLSDQSIAPPLIIRR